jgi:hypothetical protein
MFFVSREAFVHAKGGPLREPPALLGTVVLPGASSHGQGGKESSRNHGDGGSVMRGKLR